MADKFSLTLTTSITLAEQFQQALSSPNTTPSTAHSGKDALPLLSASATALKAQVTKLSLLAITSPFTPSAAVSVLSDLNDSVLPTLVSAAMLVTPDFHTKAFQGEVRNLTKTTLKEVLSLLGEVKNVAAKKDEEKKAKKQESDLAQGEKDVVTVATGRVWDSCDVLVDVAAKGVVGFVVRRVEEWRDLVRDAVEEIEEWDPEEEGDEFFDELLSDDGEGDAKDDDDEGGDGDSAALHEQKKTTLRVLKPVGQVYPAVVAHRLKKAVESPAVVKKLGSLMTQLQRIPENIDEVAGALYEEDWEKCTQYLRKTKDCAVKAVDLVVTPLDDSADSQQRTDDKFVTWSKTWMKVIEEVSKPIGGSAGAE